MYMDQPKTKCVAMDVLPPALAPLGRVPAVLKVRQTTSIIMTFLWLGVTMANWEAIRSLDEEENWVERNRVLSKTDHLDIVANAKVCRHS